MLVAALLLLLVAVSLLVAGILGGSETVTLDIGVGNFEVTATVVFVLGMVTLLLFGLSLSFFRQAGRRAAARRRDRKRVSELSEKLEQIEREKKGEQTAPTE